MYLEAAKHSVEPALTVTEQDTYLYQSGWYRRDDPVIRSLVRDDRGPDDLFIFSGRIPGLEEETINKHRKGKGLWQTIRN